MINVKMLLFAKWIAICYANILPIQSEEWWIERLKYFNKVIYPRYIKNKVVKTTQERILKKFA